MTAPSINPAISVSDNATTPITSQPKTFTIANLSEAPIGMRTVARIEQKQSGQQQVNCMQLPNELWLHCIEEAVRLDPGKVPENLAKLREVCELFCDLADRIERTTEDIAHVSTARKIRNVMFATQSRHLRQPTLNALFATWNHIPLSLSGITNPEDRIMLLKTLAEQRDKGSLFLALNDVQPCELASLHRIAENNPEASIELSLTGRTLSPSETIDLLRPFVEHQSVAKLRLYQTPLDNQAFQDLFSLIPKSSKLTTLEFQGITRNGFHAFIRGGMRSLAAVLPDLKSLTELDLSHSSIKSDEMRELAAIAEQLPRIRYLSLGSNWLHGDWMKHLCSVLRSLRSSIEFLDIAGLAMRCDSVELLVGVLPELEHLKFLKLDDNMFGERGMQALIPVLAAHPSLEELSMTECACVDFRMITLLVEELARSGNSSLRFLALDWKASLQTGATDTRTLLPMLKEIASLRTVTLPGDNGALKNIELKRN